MRVHRHQPAGGSTVFCLMVPAPRFLYVVGTADLMTKNIGLAICRANLEDGISCIFLNSKDSDDCNTYPNIHPFLYLLKPSNVLICVHDVHRHTRIRAALNWSSPLRAPACPSPAPWAPLPRLRLTPRQTSLKPAKTRTGN